MIHPPSAVLVRSPSVEQRSKEDGTVHRSVYHSLNGSMTRSVSDRQRYLRSRQTQCQQSQQVNIDLTRR